MIIQLAEAALAVVMAAVLIKVGYDGDYFGGFLINFFMQAVFVLFTFLPLRKLVENHTALIIAAAAVSFLFPMIGFFAFKGKNRRQERRFAEDMKRGAERASAELEKERQARAKEVESIRQIQNAIYNSEKGRQFLSFLQNNSERIGYIDDAGTVLCAPYGVPMFELVEDGDYMKTIWSPKLGFPAIGYRQNGAVYQWERVDFFQIGPGERQWTLQEKLAIALLVEDLLPGGKAAWEGNYLNEVIWNNGFKTDVDHDFHNYCDHRRKLPQRVLRQNLKRPY